MPQDDYSRNPLEIFVYHMCQITISDQLEVILRLRGY